MDLGILFTHHQIDEATLYNLKSLKKHNPNKKIYTIGFKRKNLIAGSFIVDDNQEYLPKNSSEIKSLGHSDWTQADLLIYDFVYHNKLLHDKYLIIEWDTYCNCSIEEFYGDALNKESFGHIVHDANIENWYWFKILNENQKKSIQKFGGYTPTSGLLFSKNTLLKINDLIIDNPRKYDNMFSELRLGSLTKAAGVELDKPFLNSEKYINWSFRLIDFKKTKKGYYHPIKQIIC